MLQSLKNITSFSMNDPLSPSTVYTQVESLLEATREHPCISACSRILATVMALETPMALRRLEA